MRNRIPKGLPPQMKTRQLIERIVGEARTVDMTSPAKAMEYLRSLPLSQEIEIVDARHEVPDAANDAIRAITGLSSIEWAHAQNRYVWTARALVQALQHEIE